MLSVYLSYRVAGADLQSKFGGGIECWRMAFALSALPVTLVRASVPLVRRGRVAFNTGRHRRASIEGNIDDGCYAITVCSRRHGALVVAGSWAEDWGSAVARRGCIRSMCWGRRERWGRREAAGLGGEGLNA